MSNLDQIETYEEFAERSLTTLEYIEECNRESATSIAQNGAIYEVLLQFNDSCIIMQDIKR